MVPRRVKRFLKRPVARWIELRCRWSKRRVGLALCYHRISDPQGDPERELVPPLGIKGFEAHVRYLNRHCRLVRASELLEAARERRRGEPFPVAITFDDDLPSHVQGAMPVLERHGAPATFFLCGASLERPFAFWWERLQRAWDRGRVDRADAPGARGRRGRPRAADDQAASPLQSRRCLPVGAARSPRSWGTMPVPIHRTLACARAT